MQEGQHPSERYEFPTAGSLSVEAERDLALSIEQIIEDLRLGFTERIHRFLQANYPLALTPSNLAHLERGGFRKAFVALETLSGKEDEFGGYLVKHLLAMLGKFSEEANADEGENSQICGEPDANTRSDGFQLSPVDLVVVRAALQAIRPKLEILTSVHARIPNALAKAYIGRGVPIEDLRQDAHLGLRKAVLNFQSTTNVPLKVFARRVIHRQLLDVTRSANGGNSHTGREISDYYDSSVRLGHRFGRQPTEDEIGTELGMTDKQFSKLLAVRAVVEKKPLPSTDEHTENSLCAKDDSNDDVESSEQLLAAITTLPADQREVIMLHYFRGVATLKDVASQLGLTIDQVRYRHRVALASLGKTIGAPAKSSSAKRFA